MPTTAATTRTHGIFGWMRTLLVVAGVAVLLTSASQPAGAEEKSAYDRAVDQITACENLGGTATVDVTRSPNGSVNITVTCTGGWLGGIECSNWQGWKTFCFADAARDDGHLTRTQMAAIDHVLPVLETGTGAQIASAVEAIQSDGAFQAELTSTRSADATLPGDDAHADKADTHHKHGKHGRQNQHRSKGHRH